MPMPAPSATNRTISRRRFVRASAAATVAGGFFVNPVAADDSKSPNERLNIAAVGTLNRALANIKRCDKENIVALVDVDQQFLDRTGGQYPEARKYRDYRVMLEKEADRIDAVLVGTPDHNHAPAAAMALRMGKHVYCEKPLTHTVKEARVLSDLATEQKLVTQMGTQIHAQDNYRRVVELVESGAIGPVRECHVWAGAVYKDGKFDHSEPAPAYLDWDLWLGPAPQRPYSKGVHPFDWRRFWDFGTGSLGDFGCHYMDLAHWALKLRHPTRITAQGPPYDPVGTPAWCIVEYQYPARDQLPPVKLTWYDSGKRPAKLAEMTDATDQNGKPMKTRSGQLFIGEKGMLLSNYSQRCLLPSKSYADFEPPAQYLPKSIGHQQEWIHAIKTGGTTTCNFDYSGALTEAVLLGTVAYRSGESIEWDAANLRVTNAPTAQQFVHKEYRRGWDL